VTRISKLGVEQVVLGKILRTYGDNGELIVQLYEDFAEEFTDPKEPVWVTIDSLPTPIFISSFATRGATKATVIFDDFDNEQRASMLVGMEFFVNRIDDPLNDDQLYMEDLIGFEIVVNNLSQGTIIDYIDDQMNPLFEVEREGSDVLIPAHDDLIVELKITDKIVVMNLPDGIFDL
jgi:16S rRNA processing protein RimM